MKTVSVLQYSIAPEVGYAGSIVDSRFRYQARYCEENAWHLCQTAPLRDAAPHVIVVSNESRHVAMWSQRAAPADAPIVWDYHVFVVANTDGWQVWDLDCRVGMPLTVGAYAQATFATVGIQPVEFDPVFRIATADEYRSGLRTDRSHMRANDGSWLAPPPQWPLISPAEHGSNLLRFVDMADDIAGDRATLPQLLQRFASDRP